MESTPLLIDVNENEITVNNKRSRNKWIFGILGLLVICLLAYHYYDNGTADNQKYVNIIADPPKPEPKQPCKGGFSSCEKDSDCCNPKDYQCKYEEGMEDYGKLCLEKPKPPKKEANKPKPKPKPKVNTNIIADPPKPKAKQPCKGGFSSCEKDSDCCNPKDYECKYEEGMEDYGKLCLEKPKPPKKEANKPKTANINTDCKGGFSSCEKDSDCCNPKDYECKYEEGMEDYGKLCLEKPKPPPKQPKEEKKESKKPPNPKINKNNIQVNCKGGFSSCEKDSDCCNPKDYECKYEEGMEDYGMLCLEKPKPPKQPKQPKQEPKKPKN